MIELYLLIIFQTALCNTALDNPGKITSHDIANYLLEYYPTDTLLFHSDVSLVIHLNRFTRLHFV